MKLNEILKIKREESGLTVSELARSLKEKEKTVVKWEDGKRVPKRSELNTLAHMYDMSSFDLVPDMKKYKRKLFFQTYRLAFLLIITVVIFFVGLPTVDEVRMWGLRGECHNEAVYEAVESDEFVTISFTEYEEITLEQVVYCVPIEGKLVIPKSEFVDDAKLSSYLHLDISPAFRVVMSNARVEDDFVKVSYILFKELPTTNKLQDNEFREYYEYFLPF